MPRRFSRDGAGINNLASPFSFSSLFFPPFLFSVRFTATLYPTRTHWKGKKGDQYQRTARFHLFFLFLSRSFENNLPLIKHVLRFSLYTVLRKRCFQPRELAPERCHLPPVSSIGYRNFPDRSNTRETFNSKFRATLLHRVFPAWRETSIFLSYFPLFVHSPWEFFFFNSRCSSSLTPPLGSRHVFSSTLYTTNPSSRVLDDAYDAHDQSQRSFTFDFL